MNHVACDCISQPKKSHLMSICKYSSYGSFFQIKAREKYTDDGGATWEGYGIKSSFPHLGHRSFVRVDY